MVQRYWVRSPPKTSPANVRILWEFEQLWRQLAKAQIDDLVDVRTLLLIPEDLDPQAARPAGGQGVSGDARRQHLPGSMLAPPTEPEDRIHGRCPGNGAGRDPQFDRDSAGPDDDRRV